MSVAERFYLLMERRSRRSLAMKYLYYVTFKPVWVAHLWARGEREWSTRMYDEQLGDLL